MSAASWILFAVCALAALAFVLFLYRRRETPGKGRPLLAALRASALVLLLLLLFDPRLPARGVAPGQRGEQVLLDGSLSMGLPGDGGGTRWAAAVAQASDLAEGRDVLLFGASTVAVSPDSLGRLEPAAASSRLLPALEAASEAGVRRVVVITDGGIDDAAQVARWLPRLGLDVDYRTIGGSAANRAVAEVDAPAWAQTGEPVDIRFGVTATGESGDSVRVSVQRDGQVLAQAVVAAPEAGRVSAGTIRFTPDTPGEAVRYEVALAGGDASPDDDTRSIYLRVSDDPAGVVLVSFAPDWEPRFLLPVLERALGIPVVGYLLAGPNEFVRAGESMEAGGRLPIEQVTRALAAADLVVFHAWDSDAPGWAGDALAAARRVIVLPGRGDPPLPFPVELDQAVRDDWYLSADLPGSPVAPQLTGLDLASVPPLTALHRTPLPAGAWAPLLASRGRRGAASPLAVGGTTDGRRWVVATGEGYWRWAFRGGVARQTYERLWGGLAGWLLQEQGAVTAAAVRPVRRVVARGERIAWTAPGLSPDSIAVQVLAAGDTLARDTVLALAAGDTVAGPAMAPGHYTYHLRAIDAGQTVAEAEGVLTVERYSPEFSRPAVDFAQLEAGVVPVGTGARALPGRPLHAAAWPYVLLVILVAAEWVLRRRWGLR